MDNMALKDREQANAKLAGMAAQPMDKAELVTITLEAKSGGADYDVWADWLKRGGNYIEGESRRLWDSIKTNALAARTITPKPVTPRAIMNHIRNCQKHQGKAAAFLERWGLTGATAERFGIGYDNDSAAIVIPYPQTLYYAERSTEGLCSESKPDSEGRPVFNIPALRNGAPYVFVAAGHWDAMAIEQCGAACIASDNAAELLAELALAQRDGKPITAEAFFIVTTLGEAAQWAIEIENALEQAGYGAQFHILPEKCSSVADWNTNDPEAVKNWLAKARTDYGIDSKKALEEYQGKATQAGRHAAFLAEVQNGLKVTPTCFGRLDRAIGGGLTEGLIIIGAKSSMGKTTFALQLADQIAGNPFADQGRDILYFSLEQRSAELMSKSISRLLYQEHHIEYSALDIRTKYRYAPREIKEAIEAAVDQYAQGAGKRLYIWEARGTAVTVEYIRQKTAEHCQITGGSPIIIVDYLQILSGSDPRMDSMDILNTAIKDLTAISRDFKTTVLIISSLNRANYKNDSEMQSFKGSNNIEYSADLLLALQPDYEKLDVDKKDIKDFDEDSWKKQDIRFTEIKILKNRNGLTGVRIQFEYKPKCDTFTEASEQSKSGFAGDF